MKVVKPLQISYFPNFQRFSGEWYQLHTGILAWDLTTGDTRTEIDLWKAAGPLNTKQIPIDEFSPKPHSEFLVFGSFWSPRGAPVEAGYVEVEVGETTKRLSVFGERRWKSAAGLVTTFTKPEPFLSLPIDWENAFGGPKYETNPLGIGLDEDPETGDRPLPRVEIYGQEMGDHKSRPASASYLPIPVSHPERAECRGSYDGDYLEKFFPGYPDDLDTRFFNRTPEDQWIQNDLTAGCSFSIRNMHPTKDIISGFIPDFLIRVFQIPKANDGNQFDEVVMRPDTVWFFPEAELGALIFHGSNPTEFHDWEHLESITVAYERRSQERKSVAHYERSVRARVTGQLQELQMMANGTDLIPYGEKTLMAIFEEKPEDTLKMYGPDRATEKAKEEARKLLDEEEKALALREKSLGDLPKESAAEIQKLVDEKKQFLATSRERLDGDSTVDLDDKEKRFLVAAEKLTPRKKDGSLDLEKFDVTAIQEITEATEDLAGGGLPSLKESMEDGARMVDAGFNEAMKDLEDSVSPKSMEEVKKNLDPEELQLLEDKKTEMLQEARKKYEEVRDSVLEQDRVPLPRPPAVTGLMEALGSVDIEGMLQKAQDTAQDYINSQGGAPEGFEDSMAVEFARVETISNDELEELITNLKKQLPSAEEGDKLWHEGYAMGCHQFPDGDPPHEFSEGQLKDRLIQRMERDIKRPRIDDFAELKLSDTNLTKLDLSAAYFEQSRLDGVTWTNCDLSGAVFARSYINDSSFIDCNLTKTSLGGIKASGCRFVRCEFSETALSKSNFSQCRFEKCNFDSNIIQEAEFLETTFDDCEFIGAIFQDSKCLETTFTRSLLERIIFQNSALNSFSINESDVIRSIFMGGSLTSSKLTKTKFEKIFFGAELKIRRSLFEECNMNMMNFRDLDLRNSVFRGVLATLSEFSNARFANVSWLDNQFLQCRFLKTDLKEAVVDRCDFSNSNMQEADLRDGRFSGSSFFSVQFLHAKVGGAHFSECDLGRTLLEDWSP